MNTSFISVSHAGWTNYRHLPVENIGKGKKIIWRKRVGNSTEKNKLKCIRKKKGNKRKVNEAKTGAKTGAWRVSRAPYYIHRA